ncbi:hypothetical protein IMG5_100600 [Ichthyophthirius multifiliis]|uniref:Cyclic nucleotide-binding domain-containing protein n=1 Tax=Ichthyophthirius multifiliis TaxID=5932 RepID=G0QSB1_ICHMU|nr:hypothetical protein IMG5_100600 [Ichthyophthirius multifiliis]EGR31909.1 hypothetical protein IMG5_100600 [Ichthyophthirius multifiliis]|eukprot:XP_004035395.1 hypothetical protein IMG5_100600 [Ichthyophthirius multifiliis]
MYLNLQEELEAQVPHQDFEKWEYNNLKLQMINHRIIHIILLKNTLQLMQIFIFLNIYFFFYIKQNKKLFGLFLISLLLLLILYLFLSNILLQYKIQVFQLFQFKNFLFLLLELKYFLLFLQQIFMNYIKERFLFDLIIFILFCIGNRNNLYTDLFILLKVQDIFNILREIDERFQFKGKIQNIYELSKIIIFILIFAHFLACCWHQAGVYSFNQGEQETWLGKTYQDHYNENNNKQIYIQSMYWAVVSMITLGYGDIIPKNQIEMVFVIFATLLSCIIFAYAMNSIGEILKQMGRKKLILKQQMGIINTYMRKRCLNQEIQVKVRKYFEYLNKEQMEDNEQSSQLILNMPQSLKEEVFQDVYGQILKSKKMLNLHFSNQFLMELSMQMKEKRYGPEEILLKQNNVSKNLYFIMKGKGDLFNEINFFTEKISEFTAITGNVTSLAILEKCSFLQIIKKFPKDYEQYCYMRDNIKLYENIQGMDHQCVGCSSYSHTLESCQYVNFVRNRQKILAYYTKNNYFFRIGIILKEKDKLNHGILGKNLIIHLLLKNKLNKKNNKQ